MRHYFVLCDRSWPWLGNDEKQYWTKSLSAGEVILRAAEWVFQFCGRGKPALFCWYQAAQVIKDCMKLGLLEVWDVVVFYGSGHEEVLQSDGMAWVLPLMGVR